MSPLICGHYQFEDVTNSLIEVCTRPSIRLTHQTEEGGFWFDYIDDETTASFVVEKTIEQEHFPRVQSGLCDFMN
jgi:hypothetical protein